MSSSGAEKTVVRAQPQIPRSVQVENSPLRDDPVRAWTAVLLLVLASTVAGFVAESGPMGGLCFLALAAAGWRVWARLTYELTSRGVTYTILGRSRRIPWARITRHEERERGLLLFTDDNPTTRSTFIIRWSDQREAILDVVRFYMRQRVSVESTETLINTSGEK
ncbi:MAG: hypothetical protein CMJ64_05975 [Planctomycetaceae bacterium]|nr:hypothetical protein [Planctomycetaceae bacterium]